MLIDFIYLFKKYKLNINGILHIGAHYCEELNKYMNIGIKEENIVWIEGNTKIVDNIKKQFPNRKIYNELISDADDQEVSFIITNNGESSSILELKEHLKEHPHVYEVSRENRKTTTIDTFLEKNKIDFSHLNFVNIDIQGAELKALKGMKIFLRFVDYLYLEVNTKELYQGCGLLEQIDEYLSDFGFKRKEINMTSHGWGDAFYIKEK
jgi:FkbM family methyltransferase